MMVRWFLLIVFATFFCCVPATFADELESELDRDLPIEVTAQQLEVLQLQRQSVFTGDVVVQQGDMTLYAEKLIIYLQDNQDEVDRLEAMGEVRFVQLERVATAEKAIFYQKDEVLVLTGNAVVIEGKNKISGDEMTLFMKEDRIMIKSSDEKRVKAVVVPEEKKEKP